MQNHSSRVVHKDDRNNVLVEVRDTATQRSLYFDNGHLQSAMSFLQPQELILSYTRYMLLGLLINQQPRNILLIGVGAGSFIRFFQHYYPETQIDAVDYSQRVIDIARSYFQLPEAENINIICTDGNEFVTRPSKKRYDLILVDAFDAQGMAPSIYRESFFEPVRELLTEEGSISFNLWSSDRKFFAHIKKSLANSFHSCLFLPVPDRGNVIAVTMDGDVPWNKIDLPPKELKAISNRLQLDFKQLVRITKQNNGNLKARLQSLFR